MASRLHAIYDRYDQILELVPTNVLQMGPTVYTKKTSEQTFKGIAMFCYQCLCSVLLTYFFYLPKGERCSQFLLCLKDIVKVRGSSTNITEINFGHVLLLQVSRFYPADLTDHDAKGM